MGVLKFGGARWMVPGLAALLLCAASASAMPRKSKPAAIVDAKKCGPGGEQFAVHTDSAALGPMTNPVAARIVIFQPGESVTSSAEVFRVGLDGKWVGALANYSWQLFVVKPGKHHVCVSWQSPLQALAAQHARAVVQAHAGQTSFLELTISRSGSKVTTFSLFGVGPTEGGDMASALPHAVATARRPVR